MSCLLQWMLSQVCLQWILAHVWANDELGTLEVDDIVDRLWDDQPRQRSV